MILLKNFPKRVFLWGICGTVAILDNVEGVCTFNF